MLVVKNNFGELICLAFSTSKLIYRLCIDVNLESGSSESVCSRCVYHQVSLFCICISKFL